MTDTPPPMFTIVIPVWKTTHLEEALESARRQQASRLEILVLDDHSPEDVAAIVQKAAGDPRVRYLRLEQNLGANDPSRTWTRGLELARGDFIVILGDDDILADNYLQEITRAMQRHPEADLYRVRLRLIGPDGSPRQISPEHPELEAWDDFLYSKNQYKYPVSTAEMCARVSSLRSMGGYVQTPLALGGDQLTWVALALRHPVVSTHATYACWRVHPGSICGSIGRPELRIHALQESLKAELEIIEHHEPPRIPRELLRQATQNYWHSHIHYIQTRATREGRAKWLFRLASLLLPSFIETRFKKKYWQWKNRHPGHT